MQFGSPLHFLSTARQFGGRCFYADCFILLSMTFPSPPRPLVVTILDGWGISLTKEGNAILASSTPNMDMFASHYPTASLVAAGLEVGLPWGEMGNSETGHRNIGAGEVQYQVLPQIDKALSDKTFFSNQVLLNALEHAKINNSQLHLLGLFSPGGVHSHMNHLFALLELCAKQKLQQPVFIHLFTDGRDSPPQSALTYLLQLEETIGRWSVGKVATITGRFYAMDRNENWERTKATYELLIGKSRVAGAPSARSALESSYQQGVFDEVIVPTAITRGGEAMGAMQDNDSIIFFNFRPDRARQLTRAFIDPASVGFDVKPLKNILFTTMASFDQTFPVPVAFPEEKLAYPLARVIADAGLQQFHIAETEKYAHITYYLNVGNEQPFPGETQVLIKSSSTADFANVPRMAAEEITNRVVHEIEQGLYDVYFINFANADMVGHTGNFGAAKEACAFVDECLGKIHTAVQTAGGALIITADHGNAEEMINGETGAVETDHTTNPVPFHYVIEHLKRTTPKSEKEVQEILSSPIGVLADVAPTILEILKLQKPSTMGGVSLLSSLR